MNNVLYVIIPCYNEEEVLPLTYRMFLDVLQRLIREEKVGVNSRVLFVDDGSKDNTWNIICNLSKQYSEIIGIQQSRNRGHQNAVLAGLLDSIDKCDMAITIDCDGQDDVDCIEKMVDKYHEGFDIVYGVRDNRNSDTIFKKYSAQSFYMIMKYLGVDIIYNHADYRLLSKNALEGLTKFQEVNLFLRGLIPLIGFKYTKVYYQRNIRMAGESHYPLRKMISLALEGITSFSIRPLRIIIVVGFLVSFLSFGFGIWVVVGYFFSRTVSGWTSIVALLCFLCGIQLICLGIIGEYIGKIYLEVKNRPKFIISART